MRYLRSYLLASIAASVVFALGLAGIEKEHNVGNILAGWTVFIPYALLFTAVLAPLGYFLLRKLRRCGYTHFALVGLGLGWLSTMVLFRGPYGLVDPMALAFGGAGLAAGLGFRAAFGPSSAGADRFASIRRSGC